MPLPRCAARLDHHADAFCASHVSRVSGFKRGLNTNHVRHLMDRNASRILARPW